MIFTLTGAISHNLFVKEEHHIFRLWDWVIRPAGSVRLQSQVGVNRLLNWPHAAKTRSTPPPSLKLEEGKWRRATNKELSIQIIPSPFKAHPIHLKRYSGP